MDLAIRSQRMEISATLVNSYASSVTTISFCFLSDAVLTSLSLTSLTTFFRRVRKMFLENLRSSHSWWSIINGCLTRSK